MNTVYKKIIEQMKISGKRLLEKAGRIEDIGVVKKHLTEEDIRIERELKGIVKGYNPAHGFYAEEENENFLDADDVWVVDPISGTHVFIDGLPHYGIVVSHIHKHVVQFAAVYDPSMDELYTAYRGKGAYRDGDQMTMRVTPSERKKILFVLSLEWKDDVAAQKMFCTLSRYELYRLRGSHAVYDCHVARGKYHGAIAFAKDSFPSFASSLIVREAGGIFTNIDGEENIKPSDRVFISGDRTTYQELRSIVKGVLQS